MYAIIESGGKQYRVEPEQIIQVEKLQAADNGEVVFDKILLVNKNDKVSVGQPLVKGAKVVGRLLGEVLDKKREIFDYKCKVNVRRKKGHRQTLSRVLVEKIVTGARKKKETEDGA